MKCCENRYFRYKCVCEYRPATVDSATSRGVNHGVTGWSGKAQQELEVDLKIIHALRSHALPDGKLDYSVNLYATFDGAWQSVHQNGALSLMPQKELTDDAWFYGLLLDLMNAEASLMPTMKIAGAMAASASSEPLDIHQLDELTSKTIEAQGQLDYMRMFLDIEEGGLKYFDKARA